MITPHQERAMRLRYSGLEASQFRPLFVLDDAGLAARGAVRLKAEPGSPCRISLEDAQPGESLLLLAFEHQAAASPYRSSGPIFVRENAAKAYESDVPPRSSAPGSCLCAPMMRQG
jgi:Protein of unknown function (DUF1203)